MRTIRLPVARAWLGVLNPLSPSRNQQLKSLAAVPVGVVIAGSPNQNERAIWPARFIYFTSLAYTTDFLLRSRISI